MVLSVVFGLIGLVVAGLYLLHWKKKRSYLYQTIEKYFPGPTPQPFFGNALEFNLSSKGVTDLMMKYAKENSRYFRLWLGPDAFVLLYDPKDAEVLLSSSTEITKSDVYKFTTPWIGYGLLTSTGAKWKSRRRILTPTFHFKILDDFVETFESNGQILISKLRENVNKPAFNVYPYANLYALDNICETAMGTPINAQNQRDSSYVAAIKSMCNVVNMRSFRPWLMPDLTFNMSKYGAIQRNALAILHTQTINTIRSRREEIRRKKTEGVTQVYNDDGLNTKRKLAFLDLLLESAEGSTLSDADIQEEVDTFMFEGHDTITSAIAFTLYALSQNTEIQEKVYEEQREIFEDMKRVATHKDYQEMKYLERVIKEAQRLFPSVPIIGRKLDKDLVLHDGVRLPQGCQAFVFMPALHTNPKIWPNSDKFDPDRFLPENAATRSPYSQVAFSAGPRNCIGQRFAYMELKSCISKVVRNFKLLPCTKEERPQLVNELVTVSCNGVNIRLEERH